jgi:hypothetical protein
MPLFLLGYARAVAAFFPNADPGLQRGRPGAFLERPTGAELGCFRDSGKGAGRFSPSSRPVQRSVPPLLA